MFISFDTSILFLKNYSNHFIKTKKIKFEKNFSKLIFSTCMLNGNSIATSQYSNIFTNKKSINTKNGLKIITFTKGNGTKPKWGDFIKINYVIYLLTNNNIEKIDSTYERHNSFIFRHGSGQVIMGIEEAIHKMNEGDKKRIIIPDNLGYISPNLGPIPPSASTRQKLFNKNKNRNLKNNALLLMDIELVNIFKSL
jgi:FKBP-type peptidyl-prolyl cis-trans isomerase